MKLIYLLQTFFVMPYVTASYVFSYTWPVKTIQSACVVRPAAVVSGKKKLLKMKKRKELLLGP